MDLKFHVRRLMIVPGPSLRTRGQSAITELAFKLLKDKGKRLLLMSSYLFFHGIKQPCCEDFTQMIDQ